MPTVGFVRFVPLVLSPVLLLVAIMLPPFNLMRPLHHYQVTFDISQSMNVSDVAIAGEAATRLELAKEATLRLMSELPCGSRIGWSVFAGQRILPLIKPVEVCEHYEGLLSSLDLIDGRMRWLNASSIGKGVHQSLRAAHAMGDNVSVVMISDGHEAPPLRPGQRGIPKSENLGVRGVLAGVGGEVATRIPKTDRQGRVTGYWQAHEVIQQPGVDDRPGNEELSRLNSEHMIQLSQHAELQYLQITHADSLSDALIRTRSDSDFANKALAPVDLRWVPALFALILLCGFFWGSWRTGRRTVK